MEGLKLSLPRYDTDPTLSYIVIPDERCNTASETHGRTVWVVLNIPTLFLNKVIRHPVGGDEEHTSW